MKKRHIAIYICWISFFFVAMFIALFLIMRDSNTNSLVSETQPEENTFPVCISDYKYHSANNKQMYAGLQMTVIDGKLYAMKNGKLWALGTGNLQNAPRLDGTVLALFNEHVYYKVQNGDSYAIYSYNYLSREKKYVGDFLVNNAFFADIYCTEDGAVNIPVDGNRTAYYSVDVNQNVTTKSEVEVYSYGQKNYMLEGVWQRKELISIDEYGHRTSYSDTIPIGNHIMIPCENGLLIHTPGSSKLLFYVNGETGEIIELFSAECIDSTSAVNVHNENVFFSLIRYTQQGAVGLKSDTYDEMNGTYRINLIDLSIEKISSEGYRGLFIFDDSGIYAHCIDGEIVKLSFDGEVLETVS